MKYDFDELTDRTHQDSYKWDVKDGELPMWVADMDFKTAPEITSYIIKRAQEGIFGYNIIPEKWNESISSWWKRRHNYNIEKDWMLFSTGVVPSISSLVRRLTLPGENVLIQTPVYNIFFNSIVNNGRNVLESSLVYKNYEYSIDFDDLERKLSNPQTTMMILCNPHNPIGKIWSKEELSKIGYLCKKYNVVVISDEIHCDIVSPNKGYIPFQSVDDNCKYNSIMCIAPTKCFSLAGLQTSLIVIPNENLRNKVFRGINNDEIAEPNTFAIGATITAFNEGEEWLNQMNEYVEENKNIVSKFIEDNKLPVHLIKSEATYLLWLDCSSICEDSVLLCNYIRESTGLYLSSGSQYGDCGKKFIRMNIACPKKRLYDGLERFKKAIDNLNK